MKAFRDTVAIVTDVASVEFALAVRGVLDMARVRTDYHRIVHRQQLLTWLAGAHPRYDYTVLCAHGTTRPDGASLISVEVVEQVDGDYEAETGWVGAHVELTPASVPDLVRTGGGTLIATGCGAGREPLPSAFLQAGYDAYIGMTSPYADGESALMFTLAFFYFALSEDRGPDRMPYTDAEAVERAAAIDTAYRWGTASFRYFPGHRPG